MVTTTEERILYARLEDGGVPVIVGNGTYRMGGKTYTSARSLLIALTRHPEARHWTFERYFRVGKRAPDKRPYVLQDTPILDLFGMPPVTIVTRSTNPPVRRVRPPVVGIDLERRSHEVAKLLFAGYGRRIHGWGYDPEDVLQEVYKGLLIRNAGKCPWDARKSSFGHYVHMVCGCILSNYHRRMSRQRAMESVGVTTPTKDGFMTVDTGTACDTNLTLASYQDLAPLLDQDFAKHLMATVPPTDAQLVHDVLPLVHQGYGRQDIAIAMNLPTNKVARALKHIRSAIDAWSLNGLLSA